MSITSTRRIGSATSAPSKVDNRTFVSDNSSQFVENIDTTNNVLVRDEPDGNSGQNNQMLSRRPPQTDFNSASPDISGSIEALALSGIFEEETDTPAGHNSAKVNVYTNNQSIIKDEEIERTGRNYLKHFYEKNEHFEDIDELI